jgi:hypothetical protein
LLDRKIPAPTWCAREQACWTALGAVAFAAGSARRLSIQLQTMTR